MLYTQMLYTITQNFSQHAQIGIVKLGQIKSLRIANYCAII